MAFDQRLVRVSIEINGQLKVFDQGFYIASTGVKYSSPLAPEAEVQIANIIKSDRDYLLTECTPFNPNRTPKKIILEAGRESTGLSKIFEGNIVSCLTSGPPDLMLTFKCQYGQFLNGKIITAQQPGLTPLSKVAQGVADSLGLPLDFQATEKNISNYVFSGGALKQIEKLSEAGAVNAYVDNGRLIVKDANAPLKGVVRIISEQSGMIGIPEVTEFGVKATMLLDNQTECGGLLRVQSLVYPNISGDYIIFKLAWNITSREVPFYWIAETVRRTNVNAQ